MSEYFKYFLAKPEQFLKEIIKSPQDAQRFLKEIPEEYQDLFAKPRKPVNVCIPAIDDIAKMELTAFYNKRVDNRSSSITIQTRMYIDASEDYKYPDWKADAKMITKKYFQDWKKRQVNTKTVVSDQQSMDDLEACVEAYTHAGYAYVKGQTIGHNFTKAIVCANIQNKVITDCVMFFDGFYFKPSTWIYKQANGNLFDKNIFAKYRYAKEYKSGWVSSDQWVIS